MWKSHSEINVKVDERRVRLDKLTHPREYQDEDKVELS